MINAQVVLDPSFAVGRVDRRLFGSFVEHMGRCVYGGIYEPGHPSADEQGFRADVLELTKELGATTIRYPGGNFVSSYRWEDGVGDRSARPVRRDLAWRSIETNQFGLNEFMTWVRRAGVDPIMAVNLGTRGTAEAVDLLEYCNGEAGTQMADRRVEHGFAEPHDVTMWCLGNEMDGPWQIGAKTAHEYGRLANQTGMAMKRMDGRIELVACGSSDASMPTFGSWEATVLEECFDVVDYISLHAYYEQHGDDVASFLCSGVNMDRFISSVVVTADHVAATKRSTKHINLSFDEWNVWYKEAWPGEDALSWEQAPRLIEDSYGVADAVVVGGLLISLLKHADRVSIACLAQLVNVIAPIRAEPDTPAWRQSTFHPFAATAAHATGTVLQAAVTAPTIHTAEHGDVPIIDVAATLADGEGTSAVFMVNRSPEHAVALHLQRHHLPTDVRVRHTVIAGDFTAVNTAAHPDRIAPTTSDVNADADGSVHVILAAASWNMLTFEAR